MDIIAGVNSNAKRNRNSDDSDSTYIIGHSVCMLYERITE